MVFILQEGLGKFWDFKAFQRQLWSGSMQSHLFLVEIFSYFKAWLRNNSHTVWITHLKYTIQWFLVFSQNCATTTMNFRTFSSPQKETLHWSAASSHFSFPQLLETTYLLPISIDSLFWTFHKNAIREYVVFCDWLLSLCIMSSRFIYVVVCIHT